jgi:hypothetical protein
MRRSVPLPAGSEASRRVREALLERARADIPRPGAAVLPRCDEARRFWSERAWSEYAAVPAMSQAMLALVREGGPVDELAGLSLICADEVRHTELSRDIADALGGYVEDVPSGLSYQPQVMARASEAPFAFWVVGNGCISETLSLELMRARLRYARVAQVHEVLERVIKDEAVHARTSWLLAERILPALPSAELVELADYAGQLIEMVRCTFVTSRLPEEVRRQARRMREVTCEAGLGACPPDEADAVVERALADSILPRLCGLGVEVR